MPHTSYDNDCSTVEGRERCLTRGQHRPRGTREWVSTNNSNTHLFDSNQAFVEESSGWFIGWQWLRINGFNEWYQFSYFMMGNVRDFERERVQKRPRNAPKDKAIDVCLHVCRWQIWMYFLIRLSRVQWSVSGKDSFEVFEDSLADGLQEALSWASSLIGNESVIKLEETSVWWRLGEWHGKDMILMKLSINDRKRLSSWSHSR